MVTSVRKGLKKMLQALRDVFVIFSRWLITGRVLIHLVNLFFYYCFWLPVYIFTPSPLAQSFLFVFVIFYCGVR